MSNENTKVIRVKFDDNGRADGRSYCYHCDYDVEVGDRVIVDSPYNGYTTVTVIETNVRIRNKATKHVVNIVDDTEYRAKAAARERLAEIEKELAERRRKTEADMRERMLEKMLADDPEVQALKAEQEILNNGGRLVQVGSEDLFANFAAQLGISRREAKVLFGPMFYGPSTQNGEDDFFTAMFKSGPGYK